MGYEHIRWERRGRLGILTMNRPQSLNAWILPMGDELNHCLEIDAPEAGAVVITGEGRGFCTGLDLRAGLARRDDGTADLQPELNTYHGVVRRVRALTIPVVAAVNGPAFGVGCSLAAASDLVLAAESAVFCLSFVKVGLTPDGGSSFTIPRAVGKHRAMQMMMLGDRVDAATAHAWGLANEVLPDDALLDRAIELGTQLADGPAHAFAAMKACVNSGREFEDHLNTEARYQNELSATDDFTQAIEAFAARS